MKPQARIQTVIEILEIVETASIPLDSALGDYMRARRYIGSKDRANISERVYEIVRGHARLSWWLEKIQMEDTPRNRVIAYLVLCEGADEKRMKDMFDASRYAPAVFDKKEEHLLKALQGQKLDHPDMPDRVRLECPPEYEAVLRDITGKDFEKEMQAMLPPARLDIRVNTFLVGRDEAKKSLAADGVETEETPYSPWGLRAKEKVHLAKTKALVKGHVSIQDEGSQLIAYLCNAQPGMQVLDYCAGAGGKTLALAAAMKRKGRIVAMDTDEKRLEKGRQRFKKAQVSDIIEVRPLSDKRHRKWLRRQNESFDVVLCDVPCTGTGTWRRNPDTRWRSFAPPVEELVQTQGEILERVAGCVKPGGHLVYATCSFLPEENEKQVEAFLEKHPEFSNQPPADDRLGAPYMRLTPARHNTDGFFAAVLKKTG